MIARLRNLTTYFPILAFVCLFLAQVIFYPTGYVSIDEYDYLHNSSLIAQGDLRQSCNPAIWSQFKVADFCVSKYNLGTSVLLLPAVIVNPNLAFGISLMAVFLIGAMFYYYFRSSGTSRRTATLFALLPLLFPAFHYYGRTLFSEIYSALLITIWFISLTKLTKTNSSKWVLINATAAGLAIWVRYTNIIILIPLYLNWLVLNYRSHKQLPWKQLGLLFLLGLPWALGLLWLNNYLYGGIFKTGYHLSGEAGVYLWHQVPEFLLKFGVALLLIYPAMLVSPLWSKVKYKWGILASTIAVIIFYAGFPSTFWEGKFTDLIFGVRFLVPVIPLLMFTYAELLQRIYLKYPKIKYLYTLAAIGLLVLNIALIFQHQQFLSINSVSWPMIPKP